MASENSKPETALESSKVETITKAVDSLLKWHKSRLETEKPKLFEEEDFVYLVLTLKKIPSNGRVNPHKIPIPHSLLSPSSEQCLIIDDRANKPGRLTKDEAKKKIQSESIPVSKILKLSKLTTDYRPFEAKRKLCNSYDLFFADKSVVPLLPRLLGKQFFKKRKVPVQVDLKKRNWKEQIEKALSSALLFLRTGTCSVLKVAKMSMERDEIVENVVAAMEGVVGVFPKKWGVVRSFHVKLLESVALPVYQAVPDVRLKIEGVRDLEAALEKDEKKVRDGKDGKKGKKGRIHEIKYMDDRMSEDGDVRSDLDVAVDDIDIDIDIDDDAVGGGDKVDNDHENSEIESGGIGSKKRKKGVKGKKEALSETGGVKSSKASAKRKKKDVLETVNAAEESSIKKGSEKRKKLSAKDEGSDKKKKRGSVEKAATEDLVKKSEDKVSTEDVGSNKKKKKGSAVSTENVGSDKKTKKGSAVKAATEDLIKKSEDKVLTEDAASDKKKKKGSAVKAATEDLIKKSEDKVSTGDAGLDKKKRGSAMKAATEELIKKSKDKLFTDDAGSAKKKRADVKVKDRKSKKAV